MAYVMAELHEDTTCQEAVISYVSSIIDIHPEERARWLACIDLSDNYSLNGKIDMDLFGWRRTFLDVVKESDEYPDVPQYPFRVIGWEPPVGKERLLEMLPSSSFDFHHFSGCKVFKKYLLGDEGHD